MTFTSSFPAFQLSLSGSVLNTRPHGRGFDPARGLALIIFSAVTTVQAKCIMPVLVKSMGS